MSEIVRAFIAIELDAQAHDELARLQSVLKRSGADVKWVEPANIHLTLRFLGDVERSKAEEIKGLLEETAAGFKAFALTLKGIGAFPDISSPRVIWVGADEGAAKSTQIASALEFKLQAIGIPKEERSFHPHMTLGRVRSRRNNDELRKAIESARFEESSKISVDHLTLFRSQLTPQGSVYTPLFKANMAIS